jgi:hypothetical protein
MSYSRVCCIVCSLCIATSAAYVDSGYSRSHANQFDMLQSDEAAGTVGVSEWLGVAGTGEQSGKSCYACRMWRV